MTCESILERAAGLAALRPDDPDRAAAWEHARTCPACARVVRESERLQALLAGGRAAPPPSPAAAARVSRLVADLRAGDRRRMVWSALGAFAATALLVLGARGRSAAARDWILAALLCALAVCLVVLTRRFSLRVGAGAVLAAALAAAASGRAGPMESALGLECAALETAAACAVVAAGWVAARRGPSSIGRGFLVATGAAGALAGDAALHLTCRAHASLPHLLVFHVGGVLVAAVVVGVVWWAAETAEARL